MGHDAVLERLLDERLVVVARGLAGEDAFAVASALAAAGVHALELTLEHPTAVETIDRLRRHFGTQLLLGAGTALRMTEAEAAIAAGASYVVSPVFIPDILRCCQKAGVLYAPGALTPSEIFRAVDAGAKVVKVFPASAVTPNYIRDVLQPFRGLHPILMLTGGLDRAQIPAYLAVGIAIVGVGGAILARDELAAKQYDRIGERAREIRLVVESARS